MAKPLIQAKQFYADPSQVQKLVAWLLCSKENVADDVRRALRLKQTYNPSDAVRKIVTKHLFDPDTDTLALAEAYARSQT